ncbi:Transmembrane and ubiquitin-like domain-containing protein 1 [Orchesella cincta]|uniref:Transmembrane and ubiquitin-like domain-containing protein 1 n=1 Tax=Orchesella cincta TaxID=48709 RepID=A0A1D2N1V8_ORCCI|nr:Transmembrane and ubiquitin-like domain-containing protein 1 [Orchesella cincta]
MLLDLWEWFILINDGVDIVLSSLSSGTSYLPLSFIVVTIIFLSLSFFAWRSTDIPDLPEAPRPPYLIQITAGPGSGGARQTIADVRLISGIANFDENEILSRFQNITTAYQNISRNQATNTDRNSQPGTSRNLAGSNRATTAVDTTTGPNVRGRLPGRSFLLGLLRQTNPFTRPGGPAISNAIRAQLSSPNVVVYHRVNVYHHHIHSHLGRNNPANPTLTPQQGTNRNNDQPSATNVDSPLSPQEQSSSDISSNPQTSPVDQSVDNSQNHEQVFPDIDTVEPVNSVSTGAVQIQTAVVEGASQNTNPTASTSSSSTYASMPMRSDQSSRDGSSHPPQGKASASSSAEGDDIRFTIKFLNDTQLDVTSQLSEKIVDFKRRHFATEMSENKTVRLIFNGRVLDPDNKTLREFGIFDQCVVHCLIVNRQQHQDQHRSGGTSGNSTGAQGDSAQGNVRRVVGLPEPGMFFVAFIGIFLVFLWFICLHFGQHLFTQSAVVSLTVLTAIFLIGIVACYLPLPAN